MCVAVGVWVDGSLVGEGVVDGVGDSVCVGVLVSATSTSADGWQADKTIMSRIITYRTVFDMALFYHQILIIQHGIAILLG